MSKYTTVIDARGAGGNIFVILAKARGYMRDLGLTRGEADELMHKVIEAGSYTEALGYITEYFPVQFEEDEDARS